ncbi:MAG: RagB/SusD family nutrient uptake outer membrane protein [Pseudobacter sp.]|uniref:RagB/SusD family nutrient uptake outer membrane protein n=1 Tax=Pseudobacter sp. TaxID=2045420 RepID=UPI003F8025C4
MNKIIPAILSIALFTTACEKEFLDVDQPGVVAISSTVDYDMLLNSDDINGTFAWPLLHLNDNFEFAPNDAPTGAAGMIYTWQEQPYQDQDPVLWSFPYKAIYYANLVVNEVDGSTGGSAPEKARLKAEALLSRAYSHFCLVQLYAKPYNPATAANDPGIPYVTIADMYAKTPDRSTVKAVYEKLIADVTEALPNLPNTNIASFRGSKAAAYGLLARIYLHMKEYDKVITNADAALALKSTVLDYTLPTFVMPALVNNSEFLYLRVNTELDHFFTAILTPDAEDLLPFSDSRRDLYAAFGYALLDSHYGITVPETLLSKAEALARKTTPDLNAALTILNNLHVKRDTDHTNLSSSDKEEVIDWVVEERRRELLPSGIRWFDMRRLAAEGRTATVTRTVGSDTYVLTPDSKKYTLQIPQSVINFNPGMPQNDK